MLSRRTGATPGNDNAGRAIYMNANERYLFFWAPNSRWIMGDDYAKFSGGLTAIEEQTWCPTQVTGWNILHHDTGTWNLDPNISVIQARIGIYGI